ncbi:MAG TPA: hypothetical protein VGI97_00715 [Gemmatimonadaceae bacterium]|jgi:hypothetical protein
MTARVCPVHGEWSASGVCRWCEPKTLLDVALSGPKVMSLPVAEATPWAANRTSREWRVDAVPSPTGYETTFTLAEKVADAYVWWLEWTEPVIDFDANAIQESLLLVQHAALRWERVARRWAGKHPSPWAKLERLMRWFYQGPPSPQELKP